MLSSTAGGVYLSAADSSRSACREEHKQGVSQPFGVFLDCVQVDLMPSHLSENGHVHIEFVIDLLAYCPYWPINGNLLVGIIANHRKCIGLVLFATIL